MDLHIGDQAPDFTAQDENGTEVKLSDLRGHSVILYFYPKDQTPGCTREACSFRDNMERIAAKGVKVWGVSVDSMESHRRFKEKNSLNFPLISDTKRVITNLYGVSKNLMVTSLARRTTFLIDKEGIIREVWRDVQVSGHVDEIMEMIRELGMV